MPNKPIRIFISAPLPGVIRGAEVEFGPSALFNVLELVELRAIVSGYRSKAMPFALQEFDNLTVEFPGRSGPKLADEGISGFPVDEGNDAMSVVGSHDSINFPMSESRAIHGAEGTFSDVTFPTHNPSGISGAVAFSSPFATLAQVSVQRTVVGSVVPNHAVQGLVAD